jgi:2'-5' RNA ligase
MRLFFAVPLSEAVKAAVGEAVASIPIESPAWRWIPQDNYHLTLKFLGEVDERLLGSLRDAAVKVAVQSSSFDLIFGRFGAFPSLSRPRVLFFRVEQGVSMLGSLAQRLEDDLEPLGFEKERRPFRAHLTLARIKRRLSAEVQSKLVNVPPLPESTAQAVERFVLMRSHLDRRGATYEEISAFSLAEKP